MDTPISSDASQSKESREEMVDMLVSIDACIANAKKVRKRLLEKIASIPGDQDDSRSDSYKSCPTTPVDDQAQQSKKVASGTSHDDSSHVEDTLEVPNITRPESKNQANDIGDLSDKPQGSGENECGESVLEDESKSGNEEQTIPLDKPDWIIKNPPSPQHFPCIERETGVQVLLPSCVRHAPGPEKSQNSHSGGIAGDDLGRLDKSIKRKAIPFRAIVDLETTDNFILSSFVSTNVTAHDRFWNRTSNKIAIPDLSKVKCIFAPRFQPNGIDTSVSQLGLSGTTGVPMLIQSNMFWPTFFVCERLFAEEEYDKKFTAILGLQFFRYNFIQVQEAPCGWLPQLPPPTTSVFSDLVVHVSSCVMDAGAPADRTCSARVSRCGYGIHFPTLPGWDIFMPTTRFESNVTIERVDLIAIIRTLQLVYERLFISGRNNTKPPECRCKHITIYTSSNQIVNAFSNRLPIWRDNGFKNAKKKTVVNADCWIRLDHYKSLIAEQDTDVMLVPVTSKLNQSAENLARLGAQRAQISAGEEISMIWKYRLDEVFPLVQHSPDGFCWIKNCVLKVDEAKQIGQNAGEAKEDTGEPKQECSEVEKSVRCSRNDIETGKAAPDVSRGAERMDSIENGAIAKAKMEEAKAKMMEAEVKMEDAEVTMEEAELKMEEAEAKEGKVDGKMEEVVAEMKEVVVKMEEAEAKTEKAEAKEKEAEVKMEAAEVKMKGVQVEKLRVIAIRKEVRSKMDKSEAKLKEAKAKTEKAEAKEKEAEVKMEAAEVKMKGVKAEKLGVIAIGKEVMAIIEEADTMGTIPDDDTTYYSKDTRRTRSF